MIYSVKSLYGSIQCLQAQIVWKSSGKKQNYREQGLQLDILIEIENNKQNRSLRKKYLNTDIYCRTYKV